jgi:hypothetical protein
MTPPRALYCDFPRGRPLGHPRHPAFQRAVLVAALRMIDASTAEPLLADYPERVAGFNAESGMACTIPARFDADLSPAENEARGLRSAFERQRARRGTTMVGRALSPHQIPVFVQTLSQLADHDGTALAELPDDLQAATLDLRAYYEEAALALVDHVPEAAASEAWFFDSTIAGDVLPRGLAYLVSIGRVATDDVKFLLPLQRAHRLVSANPEEPS